MRAPLLTVAIALATLSSACKSPPAPAPVKESNPAPQTTTLSAAMLATKDAPAKPTVSAKPVVTFASAKPVASSRPLGKVYDYKDTVTLTGTIVQRSVESSRGGAFDTQFLILDTPISVHGDPGYDHDNERELWYAGTSDAKALVGKRVVYKGGLEPMRTGHHHSNVWLTGDLTPAK